MSTRENETVGELKLEWHDDKNLRTAHLTVDYAIEPRDDGDGVITPPCGGGVEITAITVEAIFCYLSWPSEEWWMFMVRDSNRPIPFEAAESVVAGYEKSPEYQRLEDVCRKHAEGEAGQ